MTRKYGRQNNIPPIGELNVYRNKNWNEKVN